MPAFFGRVRAAAVAFRSPHTAWVHKFAAAGEPAVILVHMDAKLSHDRCTLHVTRKGGGVISVTEQPMTRVGVLSASYVDLRADAGRAAE